MSEPGTRLLLRVARVLGLRRGAHSLAGADHGLPPPQRALLPVLGLLLAGLGVSSFANARAEPEAERDTGAAVALGEVPEEPDVRLHVPEARRAPEDRVRPDDIRLQSVSTAASRPRVTPPPDGAAQPVSATASGPSEVLRAALRLPGVEREALSAVMADPDVTFASTIHVGTLELAGGETLTVGIVDPRGFRVLAPRISAESQAVWDALARGELVLSHHRAGELRLRAGERIALSGGGEAAIGGLASNGEPPLVDALATWAAELEVDLRRDLLVAVRRDADVPAVAQRLEAVTGVKPHPMPPAWPARATLVGDHEPTVAAFEPFTFVPGRGGRIQIDQAWEDAHIVRAEVPILGEVRCHRLMIPQLRAALAALVDRGLADLLDPDDYGGCYLPRHIDWNPAASLSMHAWGIAIDVNVSTNWLGEDPQLDPRVVEVFEDHGFAWGGRWTRPDGMHFELRRLLAPEELPAG